MSHKAITGAAIGLLAGLALGTDVWLPRAHAQEARAGVESVFKVATRDTISFVAFRRPRR